MRTLYLIFAVIIGMIGYNINHGSVGWAIIDGFFAPLTLIKWMIYHEINVSIIQATFPWFFK